MDYNRAIQDLNGLSEGELIGRIQKEFNVSPDFQGKSPSRPHEFGMYLKGKWYRLEITGDKLSEEGLIEKLDVRLLQDHLLCPILGIQNPGRTRGSNSLAEFAGSRS